MAENKVSQDMKINEKTPKPTVKRYSSQVWLRTLVFLDHYRYHSSRN